MKGKIVIRITRKNELNLYWVFLIIWSIILGLVSLKADSVFQAGFIIISAAIIMVVAMLYQGFEIVKE